MDKEIEEKSEKIVDRVIEDEMKSSYLDYSMSVIVGRALPDVRDGFKPVHRRILFAMKDMGMFHNKPFKKSARIVGEVLGKYHPHGDAAVYDSMVRMVQPFSLRYPLIHGQGNFGSVDGDNAAAMRYTEARLGKLAEEVLQDIEKNTVKFVPNFDGSLKEPSVLPSKIPNLLINGSSGIAVGMATNIPPHNITEVCNGIIKLIEYPEIEIDELMNHIKAPDFPTGAIICGTNGVKRAYRTGRGKVVVRARTSVEDMKNRQRVIITEIPYMVNKSMLIEEIAKLVRDKRIQGISDLRDESDREGMRVVIELKTGANSDIVINQLYKHTRMQETFGVIMLALVNNEPKVLNLKQVIELFVKHRQEIVRKRTKFELKKAEERAHILEGIIIALNDIDKAIKMIKESKNVDTAKESLVSSFNLSEKQAVAILDMKLQRLTSLEQEKLRTEHKGLIQIIGELKKILGSEQKILGIIKEELEEVKQNYGDERRTTISVAEETDLEIEDLIKPEKVVVTVTHAGYIKRLPITTYKEQKRGGRGVIAAGTKEEDFVEKIFVANTHSYLLFFTNKGKVHWLKVFRLPEASRTAKGTAVVNLVNLEQDERITAYVPIKEFKEGRFLIMVTKNGTIKRTPLDNFSNPRKGGIIALSLNEGDQLTSVKLTNGSREMIIASAKGMAVKFNEKDLRPMGRTAAGVRGIKLKGDDYVVGMVKAISGKTILTITEKGFGKRTLVEDYRLIKRGGVGVINIKITEKNGNVVGIKSVDDDDGLMFITRNGIIIRIAANGISTIGRNTQGVRVMRLDDTDSLISIAKAPRESDEGENGNGIESPEENSSEKPAEEDPEKETESSEDREEKQEDSEPNDESSNEQNPDVPSIQDLMKKKQMRKKF